MGRFLLVFTLALLILTLLLFFPIVIRTDAHFDLTRKKFAFNIALFGFLKLIGGYAATYKGGIALHLSPKKAALIPYADMDSERKRFSFLKTFRFVSFTLTTEAGAEYLMTTAIAQALLRIYFFAIGGKKENIENNLWLTDGDQLRISLRSVIFFNLFILICNFIKFLKEKTAILWQKKMKSSAI